MLFSYFNIDKHKSFLIKTQQDPKTDNIYNTKKLVI